MLVRLRVVARIAGPRVGRYNVITDCFIESKDARTQTIFMATSLKPLSSNRWIILPTRPRWTPSGLIIMKVRSSFSAIFLKSFLCRSKWKGSKFRVDGETGYWYNAWCSLNQNFKTRNEMQAATCNGRMSANAGWGRSTFWAYTIEFGSMYILRRLNNKGFITRGAKYEIKLEGARVVDMESALALRKIPCEKVPWIDALFESTPRGLQINLASM